MVFFENGHTRYGLNGKNTEKTTAKENLRFFTKTLFMR